MVDRNRLITALQLKNQDSDFGKFAWGQQLNGEVVHAFEIQGLGNLQVPFSVEDVEKLKSISEPAPHGKGLNVVVDTNVKNAWQIDGSKISALHPTNFIHTTLADISVQALYHLQLGWLVENLDSDNVEVCIDQLMLYDSGGHYKRLCELELEQGICALMILQLPVQNGYLGGRLKIDHGSTAKYFEFEKGSDHCHFLTAFRSSCKHELEPITSGWRATLVINFVWKNAFYITKIPQTLSPLVIPDVLQLLTEIRASINPWFRHFSQVTQRQNSDCPEIPTVSETETEVNQPISSCNTDAFNLQVEAVLQPSPMVLTHDVSRQLHFDLKVANIDRYYQTYLEYSSSIDVRDCVGNPTNTNKLHPKVDMLAFLLENEYPLTDLSFFGLRGHDVFLSRLLLCGNFLDVHLAIMSQPEVSTDSSREETCIGAVQMEHWISSSNTLLPFKRILVDTTNQIVSDFQLKSRCHIANQEERNENGDRIPQCYQKQPVLVIWPKYQSFRIKCLYAFDDLLDQMERQLHTASREKTIETLRRIISFCCEDPLAVFMDSTCAPGERTFRLLHLCVFLRARQEGLQLLELMTTDFRNAELCGESQSLCYEGIRSNGVAQLIAEFECRVGGWAACSRLVLKMISPIRLSNQMEFIVNLAGYLRDRCCTDGAFQIMDRVAFVLPKLEASFVASLGQKDIDSYANFVVDCEADPKTASAQRIVGFATLFPHLDPYEQCRLVVDLRRRIRFGGIPSCMHLYQELFRALPSCNLHAPGPIKHVIVAVVSSFFQLGDPELIQILMKKICSLGPNTSERPAQENRLIDVLLLSGEFWDLATSSDLGKSMLTSLIEAQILSVMCMFDQLITPSEESLAIQQIRPTGELEKLDFTKRIDFLENLSQLELHNQHCELIREARTALITTWINGFCLLLDRERSFAMPSSSTDPLQVNITVFLKTFIKMEKNLYDNNRQNVSIGFSHLFSKMSIQRLCQLILDLYKIDSVTQPCLKIVSSCFTVYRDLNRQFVGEDVISLLAPTIKLVVKIAKCLFWLGDDVSLETFCQKICTSVPLNEENLLVKKIVSCSSVWPLACTSPPSLATFYVFLDRHIDYLKTIEEPVFSFGQPCAQLPQYPEVEVFLRSSEERMTYHNLASIFHARSFADELTKVCLKNGWCSLKVQAMGSARSAFCEIVKTQDLYQMKMKRFQIVQQELSEMLSLRQNFESKSTENDLSKRLSDMHQNVENVLCSAMKSDVNEPEIIVISD